MPGHESCSSSADRTLDRLCFVLVGPDGGPGDTGGAVALVSPGGQLARAGGPDWWTHPGNAAVYAGGTVGDERVQAGGSRLGAPGGVHHSTVVGGRCYGSERDRADAFRGAGTLGGVGAGAGTHDGAGGGRRRWVDRGAGADGQRQWSHPAGALEGA